VWQVGSSESRAERASKVDADPSDPNQVILAWGVGKMAASLAKAGGS